MDEKPKVDDLITQKKEITSKIEKIQQQCKHPDQQLKMVSEMESSRMGSSYVLRWVCVECGVCSIPLEEDTKEFFK